MMLLTEEEAKAKWPVLGRKDGHSKGYIRLFAPTHPNADADGYVYEHVYVASRVLGRALRKGEVAHHVYGDTADNRNLVVCGHAYHRQLHERLAQSPDWPQFEPRPNSRPRCSVCGAPAPYKGKTGLCVEHYWQQVRASMLTCRVAGCSDRAGARSGLCLAHVKHRDNKRRHSPGWEHPSC